MGLQYAGTIYELAVRSSIFDAFEREIARPIGMQDYQPSDGQYVTGGASVYPAYPFKMSARNLARFALLYLKKGRWQDRQVIPRAWVDESTRAYSHEAELLLKRALAIREKVLGPDHPYVGQSLNNLAWLALMQRDWAQAAEHWRRATKVIEHRAKRGLAGSGHESVKGEAVRNSWYFSGLITMTDRLTPVECVDRVIRGREMFEAAQWAEASDAASSLAQMAARSRGAIPRVYSAQADPRVATTAVAFLHPTTAKTSPRG